MSSYLFATKDGADLDGLTIDLNPGALSVALTAVPGTAYGNSLTSVGVAEIKDLVKAALDAATGDTWTLTWVRANQWRWDLKWEHDGVADWDIESTGTFDLSLLGVSFLPLTVFAGQPSASGWMPWGVWYYHAGALYRRRPVFGLTTSTTVKGSGAVATRRGAKYHVWEVMYSAVRGAHLWASDLEIMPGSVSTSPDDPNLPFQTLWEAMHGFVYVVRDMDTAVSYRTKANDQGFLSDFRASTEDRTDTPLAILDLKFTLIEGVA